MAHSIPPPEKMDVDGDVSSNWQDFKDGWNNYYIATGLDKKDKTVIVATLCTFMGKECHRILKYLPLTDQERKDPDTIIKKLEEHFEPKRNVIFERYVFNSCAQDANENYDTYIQKLRELSRTCEYGNLREQMIRDRIVIGITDNEVRARLLREPDLDLNKTITMCRSSELAQKQIQHIDGNETTHAVQRRGNRHSNCIYCGRQHKPKKELCAAYGKRCSACNKMHHFATVCKSKQFVNNDRQQPIHKQTRKKTFQMHEDDDGEELDETLSEAEDNNYAIVNANGKKSFFADVKVQLQNRQAQPHIISFQLDSGSTSNTMRLADYKKLTTKPPKPSTKRLRMYNNDIMVPVGYARLQCTANGITKMIDADIVDNAPSSLLSAKSCLDFKLMQFEDCVYRTAMTKSLTEECIMEQFSDVFKGLGRIPGEYHIDIDKTVKPVKHNARRVAAPLQEAVKQKLADLESSRIIAKVTTPTQWINSMVAVRKPNKLRLCIDPSDLNKAINRNHYPTPTIDDILPSLTKARIFSVVDAKDGFLQVKLDDESSFLTTFYTPFGLYRWLRMPFGIKSAPEEFQRRLDGCLEGLKNIAVIADDILIYGTGDNDAEAEATHDKAMTALLQRCRECGLKLNKKKLKFKLDSVTYMGHVIGKEGVKPDPEKIRAIINMERPVDVQAVQRLLGMVTYLSKFLPQLSSVCEPLRRLTDHDAVFEWLPQHDDAFTEVKQLLTKAPILRYYDVTKPVEIESDSSSVGLGAVISQEGRPIAYASRALTQTERNYAQIEKECLSLVFATERFEHYILGKDNVTAWTDHKPLEMIFKKSILTSPKRLQRMRLRLQKFSINVLYKSGKTMHISDTLSRASLPVEQESKDQPDYIIFKVIDEQERREEIANTPMFEDQRVMDHKLAEIQLESKTCVEMQTLMHIIIDGWPDNKQSLPQCARDYWPYRDEMTTADGIIFRGTRIVIPVKLRKKMRIAAHSSHLGEQYTLSTAREVMFWPHMHAELLETVKQCTTCQQEQSAQQKEPMMSFPIPQFPWQSVASDCFELDHKKYVIVVDLFSGYVDFAWLPNMTTKELISRLKPIFATHGVPSEFITDNGTNYSCREFKQFAQDWNFKHITCSPHHHKSNGRAEAAVKVMKRMMKKVRQSKGDLYKALLEWRNAVTPGDVSSLVQKLMSRRTRSFLPCSSSHYHPRIESDVQQNIMKRRQKAKKYYDKHAKALPKLRVGQNVYVKTHPHLPNSTWKPGKVISEVAPRSYIVGFNGVQYRRNRIHIRSKPIIPIEDLMPTPPVPQLQKKEVEPREAEQDAGGNVLEAIPTEPAQPDVVRTRYGRVVKPNQRYAKDYITS